MIDRSEAARAAARKAMEEARAKAAAASAVNDAKRENIEQQATREEAEVAVKFEAWAAQEGIEVTEDQVLAMGSHIYQHMIASQIKLMFDALSDAKKMSEGKKPEFPFPW